uniref:Armadillo repeat-containing protein 2 n=1 Tax=Glossina brevipalpis TaxID=37001 RepID=A0A1A9WVC8_9MUSC
MKKIYLNKRRSHSESRQDEIIGIDKRSVHQRGKVRYGQQNLPLSSVTDLTIDNFGRRRTSAEMISEAKTFLNDMISSSSTTTTTTNSSSNSNININANKALANVAGVKVISTRRPTTPRETSRVLYGKVSLDGRPPSAFSLRYLQNENIRSLTKTPPILEPLAINQEKSRDEKFTKQTVESMAMVGGRSKSFDTPSYDDETCGSNVNKQIHGKLPLNRKLPALEVKGLSVSLLEPPRERAKTAYNELNNFIPKDNGVMTLLTARKLLTRSNDLLAQSSTEKLIEMLKEHAGLKECTVETVNHINSILLELYERLHKNEKSFKKGFILGGLYGLVECTSPKILLAVARVVLALRVSGSNLTGACKLIFKVARSEQNDQLFHDNDILELLVDGLGRASPLEDPEACIYGYGSIRFLTCNSCQERAELNAFKDINRNWFEQLELPRKPATAPALGEIHKMEREFKQKLNKQDELVIRLARHGAVQLMILHLQMLNETGAAQKLSGPPLHSLYQLSAALRAFADIRQYSSSLEKLETHTESIQYSSNNIQLELACPHLIKAAEITIGEIEVQNNVVRTLSVLSEDDDCCQILMSFSARLGMLLGSCCAAHVNSNANEKLLSLISRLGYILGNIMAKYDSARVQFYHNDVAMEYLINVLEIYAKEPLTLHNSMGDSVIDVLIKIIRVLANMSVNEEVGLGLGNCRSLGNILLELIKVNQQMKSIKLKQDLQELFHATLGALHNLCFYQDKNSSSPALVMDSQGSLQSLLPELTNGLCKSLKYCREDMLQVEIARVLGNLTRNEKARKQFSTAQGLPVILQILSNPVNNEIYDLKACTIGILVNVLGDLENRKPFLELNGPEILLVLLRNVIVHHPADWFLATIVCQAFWNLFIDTQHIEELCASSILDELSDLLVDHLDEEKYAKTSIDDDLPTDLWENFALVATDLLERLQTNYEQLNESMLSLTNNDGYDDNDENDVYIERN